jgi:hypothetical protein
MEAGRLDTSNDDLPTFFRHLIFFGALIEVGVPLHSLLLASRIGSVSFSLGEDEFDSADEGSRWHGHVDDFLVSGVAKIGQLKIGAEAASGA